MQYQLLISPTALNDSNAAYIYYEEQLPGLGQRFLHSVNASYQKLSHTPKYYSYINSKRELRDIKIKDFPFIIIYQIIEDKVLVLSVFNTNREPLSLKNL